MTLQQRLAVLRHENHAVDLDQDLVHDLGVEAALAAHAHEGLLGGGVGNALGLSGLLAGLLDLPGSGVGVLFVIELVA